MGEWGRERTPSILDRELHWNATLDGHLIEVACLGIGHVAAGTNLVRAIKVIVILVLHAFPNFLFDIFLNCGLPLTKFTVEAPVRRVVVKTAPIRALEEHLTASATDGWLRGKDRVLVLKRRTLFEASSSFSRLSEPSHTGSVRSNDAELVAFRAAEHGWLLRREELSGFRPIVHLGVRVDDWALPCITNVLFDLLLIIVIIRLLGRARTIQLAMHG